MSAVAWSTPSEVVGLLAPLRRLRRCLLAPPGTDLERLRRRVYEAEFGPLPAGMTVKARCVRGRCLNPFHFRVVRARGADNRVTHCRRGHPLNDAYVPPRGGRRVCRACALDTQRRRAGRLHLISASSRREA